MPKDLEPIVFDPEKCRKEIAQFKTFLGKKKNLEERADIQDFFKKKQQLSAYIGTFAPKIGVADRVAHEFDIAGDFKADIMLGNSGNKLFCAVEFEDGKVGGVFRKVKKKATLEWSRRFEHGFSQLIDWFFALDDMKKDHRFAKNFGHGHIRFYGLIILGRAEKMADYEKTRMAWRSEKVPIDSHQIECITYDDLYEDLNFRIQSYPKASAII